MIKLFLTFFVLLFFPWFVLNRLAVNDLEIQSEDTLPAMFLPVAIVKEKTLYLDSYYDMMLERYPHPDDKKKILGLTPFYLRKVEGHYLSAFPIMSGILSTPVYAIAFSLGVPVTWDSLIFLSRLSASLIVALCGVVFFAIARRFLNQLGSVVLSAVFIFSTINFASISQALWQHGTLELFLLLGILSLLKVEEKTVFVFISGVFFGFALISRPTGTVPFLIVLAYLFVFLGFKKTRNYILGGAFPIMLFFLYNQLFYSSIQNQGYASQLFNGWKTPFYLGFLGMFFSPSKGLLVYSPVLIFSFLGAYRLLKETLFDKYERGLFACFFVISSLHLVIVSMWKHWYGGWSFGYRMASDVLPFLCLLLIPYFVSSIFKKTKIFFYISVIISFAIELMGLAFFDGIWHAAYDRGYRDQAWLWSIQNSEFVFNIKRVLVKLGLLKIALP